MYVLGSPTLTWPRVIAFIIFKLKPTATHKCPMLLDFQKAAILANFSFCPKKASFLHRETSQASVKIRATIFQFAIGSLFFHTTVALLQKQAFFPRPWFNNEEYSHYSDFVIRFSYFAVLKHRVNSLELWFVVV